MGTKKFKMDDKRDFVAVRKVLRGDKNAFSFIFKKYKNYVYKKIASYLKDEDEAEDITMVVFEKAYEKLHTYKMDYTFNAWLSSIVKNALIDRHREKERHSEADVFSLSNPVHTDSIREGATELTYEVRDPVLNYEEEQVDGEEKSALMQAIDMFDDKDKQQKLYKKIIKMIYFEDMSYASVAEKLNIKITSLKPYVNRAKEIIKQNVEILLRRNEGYVS